MCLFRVRVWLKKCRLVVRLVVSCGGFCVLV